MPAIGSVGNGPSAVAGPMVPAIVSERSTGNLAVGSTRKGGGQAVARDGKRMRREWPARILGTRNGKAEGKQRSIIGLLALQAGRVTGCERATVREVKNVDVKIIIVIIIIISHNNTRQLALYKVVKLVSSRRTVLSKENRGVILRVFQLRPCPFFYGP